MNWPLLLALVAALLFALEAIHVPCPVSLGWAGLAVLAVAFAVQWDK